MPIRYIESYEEYPVYDVSETPTRDSWAVELTEEEIDRIKRCYNEYEEVHELIRKKIQEEIKIAGRKKR